MYTNAKWCTIFSTTGTNGMVFSPSEFVYYPPGSCANTRPELTA